ncbi:hypothetical protein ES703_79116 [subsurface metagenome]
MHGPTVIGVRMPPGSPVTGGSAPRLYLAPEGGELHHDPLPGCGPPGPRPSRVQVTSPAAPGGLRGKGRGVAGPVKLHRGAKAARIYHPPPLWVIYLCRPSQGIDPWLPLVVG